MKNIYYLYTISGNYDLVAIVKCGNIDELEKIIGNILDVPGVEKSMINIVFQKHKGVLSLAIP